LRQLGEWGWNQAIVTGPVASSALGRQEVRELSGRQTLTFFDSLSPSAEQNTLGFKL
jgi:folate-dependent tRNA-U54 methylase TrmFO/GidA